MRIIFKNSGSLIDTYEYEFYVPVGGGLEAVSRHNNTTIDCLSSTDIGDFNSSCDWLLDLFAAILQADQAESVHSTGILVDSDANVRLVKPLAYDECTFDSIIQYK